MESFLLWINGFWGKDGYSTAVAAQGMGLSEDTIRLFENFTREFMIKYFNDHFQPPTQAQILGAWREAHGEVVYLHTPFGDKPGAVQPVNNPLQDPLINTLRLSQLVAIIDEQLTKHGLPVK